MSLGIGPHRPGWVRLEGISKRFKAAQVLREVTFSLEPGQVGALIGTNGSGKTTLLRIIAGVLTPDRGTVSLPGSTGDRGLLGYIPAGDKGLYSRLTGRQNLEFFARLQGSPPRAVREAVDRTAEAMDATDLLSKEVGICSAGQRRRLMIARGFVARPAVVLIDEPLADLDEEGSAALQRLVRGWALGQGAVLYAAPLEEDDLRADVVLRVAEGRVDSVGPGPRSVRSDGVGSSEP